MPFQLTLYYILLLSHIIMKIVLVPLFYLSGILQGIIDRPTLFFSYLFDLIFICLIILFTLYWNRISLYIFYHFLLFL